MEICVIITFILIIELFVVVPFLRRAAICNLIRLHLVIEKTRSMNILDDSVMIITIFMPLSA